MGDILINVLTPVQVPNPIMHKGNYARLEELALEKGCTLKKIGEGCNVTREMARVMLVSRGLHDDWKKARQRELKRQHDEKREKIERIAGLAGLLCEVAKKKSSTNPALNDAFRCWRTYSLSFRRPEFDSLVKFFGEYHSAKDHGAHPSLEKLSLGMFQPMTAHHILKRIGEPPLNRITSKPRLPKKTKEKVMKAISLDTRLGFMDMTYFIGVHHSYIYSTIGAKTPLTHGPRYYALENTKMRRIGYRRAYEFLDAVNIGFSMAEAKFLSEVKLDKEAEYITANQREIKKEIAYFKQSLRIK